MINRRKVMSTNIHSSRMMININYSSNRTRKNISSPFFSGISSRSLSTIIVLIAAVVCLVDRITPVSVHAFSTLHHPTLSSISSRTTTIQPPSLSPPFSKFHVHFIPQHNDAEFILYATSTEETQTIKKKKTAKIVEPSIVPSSPSKSSSTITLRSDDIDKKEVKSDKSNSAKQENYNDGDNCEEDDDTQNGEALDDDNNSGDDDDDELRKKRAAIAMALKLKSSSKTTRSRSGSVTERKGGRDKTSVGEKRVGSASRARALGGRGGVAGRLLGGLRTSAAAKASQKSSSKGNTLLPKKTQDRSTSAAKPSKNGKDSTTSSTNSILERIDNKTRLDSDKIHSIIQELVEDQNLSSHEVTTINTNTPTAFEAASSSMGLLGEKTDQKNSSNNIHGGAIQTFPFPGTTLVYPVSPLSQLSSTSFLNKNGNNDINHSIKFSSFLKNEASVRIATPSDDVAIANLRLSVFSDFSKSIRKEFCRRSCEVLNSRRLRGATCLVARVDAQSLGRGVYGNNGKDSTSRIPKEERMFESWIMGSVECSAHEFAGTELGRRRPVGSILYITEVAVAPTVRRCGIGAMLLKGIERLAKLRNVESIYLHVDVENTAACELYKKAGYSILDSKNPLYNEFTTKLNLHDGATKGRIHYLLHKSVTDTETWLAASYAPQQAKLGFELP